MTNGRCASLWRRGCEVKAGAWRNFQPRKRHSDGETKHRGAADVLAATAFGSSDYLLRPFGPEELQSLSQPLLEQLSEHPQKSSPARRTAAYHSDIELVGRRQAFIELMKQVGRVSTTSPPVLLTGESGTGKELVASAIH